LNERIRSPKKSRATKFRYFSACGEMVDPLLPLLAAFSRASVAALAAAIPCGLRSEGVGRNVAIRSQVMVCGRLLRRARLYRRLLRGLRDEIN
jgi:hypothetical protein